uniref:Uncharacterized protein n=1 Tax=Tanacetum cinerariifolium TaxID=118510 RepID=A0A6L2NLE7_TANCI|nr:hypothetical protein [Tanacetum cinerariifolium]
MEESSKKAEESGSKKAVDELESVNLKKQKLYKNVKAEVEDDQEEVEMKKHMEIVPDEIAIDVILQATKPPIIIDCKIIKEGKMGYFQIIRADGSLKSGATNNVADENVTITSNDPLLNGENRMHLNEMMDLCTNLQKEILDLKKRKSRTLRLKRIRKVGSARRIESFDEAGLGDQEDASKQGRKIADLDADEEITLVDESAKDQGSVAQVSAVASVIINEITLAKAHEALKTSKPKIRGIAIREHKEPNKSLTTTTQPISSKSQDKGKAKMVEPKKPLKKQDQIMYDQEVTLNLQAKLEAKLEEEEERLARKKEKEANIALIES